MGETARRKATWADLLKTPDDGRRYEVLNGEIVASPSPRPTHAYVVDGLSAELGGPFGRKRGGPGGWWILGQTDVELMRHDIVVPDVAGWRRDRVPTFPAEQPIRAVPDWICEVLSPSTARRDRLVKADLYLRAGVGHLWLVDADARVVEAYEARDGAWTRLGAWDESGPARIPPFDAVEIDLTEIFPPPPPTP